MNHQSTSPLASFISHLVPEHPSSASITKPSVTAYARTSSNIDTKIHLPQPLRCMQRKVTASFAKCTLSDCASCEGNFKEFRTKDRWQVVKLSHAWLMKKILYQQDYCCLYSSLLLSTSPCQVYYSKCMLHSRLRAENHAHEQDDVDVHHQGPADLHHQGPAGWVWLLPAPNVAVSA